MDRFTLSWPHARVSELDVESSVSTCLQSKSRLLNQFRYSKIGKIREWIVFERTKIRIGVVPWQESGEICGWKIGLQIDR